MSSYSLSTIETLSSSFFLNQGKVDKGNPGMAGAGGLLRDENGRRLDGPVHFVGFASSVRAELWTAKVRLKQAWNMAYRNVI